MVGRVLGEILAVIRELCEAAGFDMVKGVGEGHVAKLLVVPAGFSVCCGVKELGPLSLVGKSSHETGRKVLPLCEQPFERHCTGDRAVIEAEDDLLTGRQPAQIGPCRVDCGAAYVFPLFTANRPYA